MKLKTCKKCKTYTLKAICRKCGGPTVSPLPPKFSIQDRYGEYRRKMKLESFKKEA